MNIALADDARKNVSENPEVSGTPCFRATTQGVSVRISKLLLLRLLVV